MRHFDLVIIGSGSGNSLPDERFSHLDVAVVEHGVFGGTCLNVGCIPTKMYVYAADVAREVTEAARYGIDATQDKIRWADIRDRVFGRIDPISEGGRRYRAEGEPNITLIAGHAEFTGPKQLSVAPTDGGPAQQISADRVVLAAGARPSIPAVILDSGIPFHTSDTIMRLDEPPERLVVLGGGFIGAEFAHVFSALGSQVSIVTRGDRLLRHLDGTVATRFTEVARQHWTVHTNAPPIGCADSGPGVHLELEDGTVVEGDTLLVATGRTPNSDRLGLDRAGIATHEDGRVVVDEYQETNLPGIYALGDICSPYQLKHVANHEAKVVAHNLANPGNRRKADHRYVPSAVFTRPQIAEVGLTEEECRERGLRHVTSVQEYGSVAYGWAMEDTTGFCKLIADPATGELLGAHVMGPQASTVIQPLIQAMSFGLPAHRMAREQYWIHPALPEVVENALLALPLDVT
ncbi:mycothione reductase [Pseudonocardia eucalypti]|uniref:Mycothione reductase n=1 Tax=Pseudonocardia eucalypti TaxID=648755 RepID=A0ABP9QDD8_9PSEU|nr:mycothione reductase [Pseudonocardia eucalypti]